MKNVLLLCISLIHIFVYSQSKTILVYDLFNQTLDSISDIDYDSTVAKAHTDYNIGNFNPSIEWLTNNPPTSNTFPGTQFTQKKIASTEFDLESYPIRTSVKIFQQANDNLVQLCSGSLISRRHVMTAAHCVSPINTNQLRMFDSLYISPIFDNGAYNTNFCNSYVRKIYFLKNWNIGGDDIAILELEKPIGESTGWLSIGFDTLDQSLSEGIFYKFSYPSVTNLWIDPNEYNGDSLYFNYGVVDDITNNTIGITNMVGIEGESGSSIIKIENDQSYISYGVLSLSFNLRHSRINNWKYFAIQSIIKDDIAMNTQSMNYDIALYPNPASQTIHIRKLSPFEITEIKIYDNAGRLCIGQQEVDSCFEIDISNLPNGYYYLSAVTAETIITKKIIKYGY